MNKTILLLASKMLSEYRHELSDHGCNDYSIPFNDENYALVLDMISKSDYPEDKPKVYGNQIDMMDFELVFYLEQELKKMADK